jgi:hypothetical protein
MLNNVALCVYHGYSRKNNSEAKFRESVIDNVSARGAMDTGWTRLGQRHERLQTPANSVMVG